MHRDICASGYGLNFVDPFEWNQLVIGIAATLPQTFEMSGRSELSYVSDSSFWGATCALGDGVTGMISPVVTRTISPRPAPVMSR